MRLDSLPSRRAAVSAALLASCASPPPAFAFENRLPPDELELKYKQPRSPGPQPTDLGPRNGNDLKSCTDGKPHCFSSTRETLEDSELLNEGNVVDPFRYDKSLSEAFNDVKAAIGAYPPGQRGIDGGGFKIMKETQDETFAYVYVQFESQRKGFIDDVEFALGKGVCNFRTSSRLGYLDLGVNAKRYAWFADKLRTLPGWKATPLRSKGHEEYFSLNRLTDQDLA
jgi:uncharacterized protein (DUF1499 family)